MTPSLFRFRTPEEDCFPVFENVFLCLIMVTCVLQCSHVLDTVSLLLILFSNVFYCSPVFNNVYPCYLVYDKLSLQALIMFSCV